MTQSQLAIHAAKHRHQWGRWATYRFCEKRGVDFRLYILACQLEAAKKSIEISPAPRIAAIGNSLVTYSSEKSELAPSGCWTFHVRTMDESPIIKQKG